mmetsp:Transcript_9065/g.31566  ORF Transcript_9065/g.31566 Transcript_9065/m.31566 type:complete len:345 (+) Transcript_9065:422-1456(+)
MPRNSLRNFSRTSLMLWPHFSYSAGRNDTASCSARRYEAPFRAVSRSAIQSSVLTRDCVLGADSVKRSTTQRSSRSRLLVSSSSWSASAATSLSTASMCFLKSEEKSSALRSARRCGPSVSSSSCAALGDAFTRSSKRRGLRGMRARRASLPSFSVRSGPEGAAAGAALATAFAGAPARDALKDADTGRALPGAPEVLAASALPPSLASPGRVGSSEEGSGSSPNLSSSGTSAASALARASAAPRVATMAAASTAAAERTSVALSAAHSDARAAIGAVSAALPALESAAATQFAASALPSAELTTLGLTACSATAETRRGAGTAEDHTSRHLETASRTLFLPSE